MHKYKNFLKNIGTLTVSNFGTKILAIILVPLYTNILSTEEYGIYDIYYTTICLSIPIVSLDISTAILRFSLDPARNKKEVFSVGIKRLVMGVVIFVVFLILNSFFSVFPVFNEYPFLLLLLFSGNIIHRLFSQMARGMERIFDLAISGVISSIVLLLTNIIFLSILKLGLAGYFVSNCLSFYVPSAYLLVRLKIWEYVTISDNAELEKEMIAYSKPFILTDLSWWINNLSDRYIIILLCGTSENGIYSVAYKIPSILNFFQTIFNQAWIVSAVKELGEESEKFYTQIYKVCNFIMVIVCSFLITMDKIISHILFAKDFYIAWKYAPFLMISSVFGTLCGMLDGVFSALKRPDILAKTTASGAIINTVLNIFMIYFFGPVGAAIATMISYIVVWAGRLKEVYKFVKLDISLVRDITSYFLLTIQGVIFLFIPSTGAYIPQIFIIFIILYIYIDEVILMIKNIVHIVNKSYNA